MYSRLNKLLLWAMLAVFMSGEALATNGSLLIGVGSKTRSLGGAGVAVPLEATSQLINPASSTELGIRAEVGAMLFVPRRQACTQIIPECIKSGSDLFLLPTMGGAYKFNRRLSLGFVGAPVAGGSTRYNRSPFELEIAGSTGADLKQMVMAFPIAYRINKNISVGVAPVLGIQAFRAYGLTTFRTPGISASPGNVSNRGNDYSYGAGVRFGLQTRFFDGRVNFGASYASRVYMTKFDKYKGLFTEDGSFDMPEQFTLGLAVKPMTDLMVVFDVTRIYFNDVPALGNTIVNSVGGADGVPQAIGRLGEKDGGGFGWQNQWVYKLGINYDWSKKLSLRLGTNYGKSPLPEDDNLLPGALAPITTEWHATVGFTYGINSSSDVSASYVHAFKNTLSNFDTGQFGIAPGGGAELSMVQNSADVTYSLRF